MRTITVSEKTPGQLRQIAALRGQDADALAEELLEVSLAVLSVKGNAVIDAQKPHRVMEFRGIAPTGRTADEIDADIERSRNEWNHDTQRGWKAIIGKFADDSLCDEAMRYGSEWRENQHDETN